MKLKIILTLCVFLQIISSVYARETVFSGTVYSKSMLNLSVEQNGLLVFVAEEGSKFRAGDPIAKIDSRYEQEQLSFLLAHQENLQAKIVERKNIVGSYAKMTENNMTSQESMAQKKIDLLNSQVELNIVEQELLRIRHTIKQKNITAPYEGVVLENKLRAHEVIQVGETVVTILNPKDLFLEVKIPLNIYETIDPQKASLANNSYTGKLTFDSLIPEVDTRSNTVKVLFKVIAKQVLVGQSLEVIFLN